MCAHDNHKNQVSLTNINHHRYLIFERQRETRRATVNIKQTNKQTSQDSNAALAPKLNRMGQSYLQEMKLLVFVLWVGHFT